MKFVVVDDNGKPVDGQVWEFRGRYMPGNKDDNVLVGSGNGVFKLPHNVECVYAIVHPVAKRHIGAGVVWEETEMRVVQRNEAFYAPRYGVEIWVASEPSRKQYPILRPVGLARDVPEVPESE